MCKLKGNVDCAEGQLNIKERQLLSNTKTACGICVAGYNEQYNTRTPLLLAAAHMWPTAGKTYTRYETQMHMAGAMKCLQQRGA